MLTSPAPWARSADISRHEGVPTDFDVEVVVPCLMSKDKERMVHKQLSTYKYNKEYFECDIKIIIKELIKTTGRMPIYASDYARDKFLDSYCFDNWNTGEIVEKEFEKLFLKEQEIKEYEKEIKKKYDSYKINEEELSDLIYEISQYKELVKNYEKKNLNFREKEQKIIDLNNKINSYPDYRAGNIDVFPAGNHLAALRIFRQELIRIKKSRLVCSSRLETLWKTLS